MVIDTSAMVAILFDEAGRAQLKRFLSLTATETVAVTPHQALIAIDAFRKHGKGRHPASPDITTK